MNYRKPGVDCPSKNCDCYDCFPLNMTESDNDYSSDDDDQLDIFAVCWDIPPLPGKRQIRLRYQRAIAKGLPLTPEEEFQRNEDLEHQKFKDFVNAFEEKMTEARALSFEAWFLDCMSALFDRIHHLFVSAYSCIIFRIGASWGRKIIHTICGCGKRQKWWRYLRRYYSARVGPSSSKVTLMSQTPKIETEFVIIDMQSPLNLR
jgi:hypothetical protein